MSLLFGEHAIHCDVLLERPYISSDLQFFKASLCDNGEYGE